MKQKKRPQKFNKKAGRSPLGGPPFPPTNPGGGKMKKGKKKPGRY